MRGRRANPASQEVTVSEVDVCTNEVIGAVRAVGGVPRIDETSETLPARLVRIGIENVIRASRQPEPLGQTITRRNVDKRHRPEDLRIVGGIGRAGRGVVWKAVLEVGPLSVITQTTSEFDRTYLVGRRKGSAILRQRVLCYLARIRVEGSGSPCDRFLDVTEGAGQRQDAVSDGLITTDDQIKPLRDRVIVVLQEVGLRNGLNIGNVQRIKRSGFGRRQHISGGGVQAIVDLDPVGVEGDLQSEGRCPDDPQGQVA